MAGFELRLKEVLKTERGAKIALIVFVAFVLAIDLIYFVFPNDVTRGAATGMFVGVIAINAIVERFRDRGVAFLCGIVFAFCQIGLVSALSVFLRLRGIHG